MGIELFRWRDHRGSSSLWSGLGGPPGLPANIAKIVDNATKEALTDPDVIDKLDKIGIEPFYLSGDAYRKFVFDEVKSIKSLKIK